MTEINLEFEGESTLGLLEPHTDETSTPIEMVSFFVGKSLEVQFVPPLTEDDPRLPVFNSMLKDIEEATSGNIITFDKSRRKLMQPTIGELALVGVPLSASQIVTHLENTPGLEISRG